MYSQHFRYAAVVVALTLFLIDIGPAPAAWTAPADEGQIILVAPLKGNGGGGPRGGGSGGDVSGRGPEHRPIPPPPPPASGVSAQDIVNAKKVGWRLHSQKGSHRQFKHEHKSGRVTVAGKASDTLPIGTRKSIARQAGLASIPRGGHQFE